MPHKHHGRCPACQTVGALTRHHILPQRMFGRGKHNEHIVLLCRPCHDKLERDIPPETVMPVYFYFAVVARFILEETRRKGVHHATRS